VEQKVKKIFASFSFEGKTTKEDYPLLNAWPEVGHFLLHWLCACVHVGTYKLVCHLALGGTALTP
jgi:hypothetical protein